MNIKNVKISGFTIVELAVVITVIGILAGVTLVGYGNWQERAAKDLVKSDLLQVAASMENAKNFGNGYPATIPSDFSSSPNVTVTLASTASGSYCINGSHVKYTAIQMSIQSSNKSNPRESFCS
jgi:prepilin-type N-terminal cleavage/methylation domain-containing protein